MLASTVLGKVQGLEKDGVLQFRGIRYATAERFGAPQAVAPWDDVYDATTFGPIAPQNASGLESMLGAKPSPSSEDCLSLNIFTPALDDGARPVMLWIHGGAFTAGTGSIPWYNGTKLVRTGDVVVVTINYRLGALGFSALDGLGAEYAGSGNRGLQDQIAAIDWVRDNIEAFGGDPARITVFGESAGGMSVAALLGVPGLPDRIVGAIPESGAAHAVRAADTAARVTELVLDELGLGTADAEALLAVDLAHLLAAQEKVNARVVRELGFRLPFAPVVDGTVLPRHPVEAVRDGAAAGVHLLVGTTANEYNLFHMMERAGGAMDADRLHSRVAKVVGEAADDVIDVYRETHPGANEDDVWCAFATDWIFRIPAIRLAEAHAPQQPDTYSYLFTYESTAFDGALRACHAIEIPFVFDNLDRGGAQFFLGAIEDSTRGLARATSRAWLAMARNGTPQHDGIPTWEAYRADHRAVMELGRTTQLLDDPGSAERQLWESLLP
jgi:para-nitrobenzyl esterase